MKKHLFIFITLILLIFTVSCGETNKEEDHTFDGITLPSEVSASFSLPSEDGLTWKSNNEDVLTSDGWLFMPDGDVDVTFTATLSGKTKDYVVKVNTSTKDKFTVAYNYYQGKVLSSYSKNNSFNVSKYGNYDVTFTSLNPNLITNEGVITQSDEDKTAIIKIVITNTETKEERTYYKKTIIKQYNADTFLANISSWVDEKVAQYRQGKLEKLPTKHEKYPSTIEWISGSFVVVLQDGSVIKPVDIVNDAISCVITYNNKQIEKTIKLDNFGGNTLEGFLDAWLPYIMPENITAHHNYVHQKYLNNGDADYYFHNQIECYTGGVLNLIDGKAITINKDYLCDVDNTTYNTKLWYTYTKDGKLTHSPNVTQEYLDSTFYPGYKIPNEDNTLWVVVHESGMALPEKNARFLAQFQYNNVYVTPTENVREASWHYQVDDQGIYQSFNDALALWHAGGNYGDPSKYYAYGNSNSIGIEMCINADGNYDGAMRMDTKLVANLLYKYGLNIQNVKRHYDFSGKQCPAYMIETNRWAEFLKYVSIEYNAIKYLSDATVTWTISDPTLFTAASNGLYYAKAVTQDTNVTITLDVVKDSYHFNKSVTITLKPDTVDLSIWDWEDLPK